MVDSHRETELRAAIEDFFYGFRSFTAVPDELLARRRLGRTHHRVLYFVAREPGIRVGKLLAILGITKQAAHAPMRELTHQGLLASTPDPVDRRARLLSLTDAGLAFERELTSAQIHVLGDAFASAGTDAEAGWRAVMARLHEAIHR